MKRTPMRVAAGVSALTLLLAACGTDDDQPAATGDRSTATEAMGDGHNAATADSAVATPAAELRAGLTNLLTEHVYLAGAAIATAVEQGGDLEHPAVESAVETLDENSQALADAVASVYGDDAGEQFLAQWRDHIGFFVDYTLGGATGDAAMQDEARQNLNEYRNDFGAFMESATDGELPAGAVADALQVHVDSLIVAIDAVLAGEPDVFTKLREAASHMPMAATALAGGIAGHQGLDGDVESAASGLRGDLTYLLVEHVYAAGLAINTAIGAGGDLEAPPVANAVAALDENSVALSDAISGLYGPEAGEQFLAQWRDHIGFFVEYTLGGATGNDEQQEQARERLDNYREDFGAFIESATGGELDADTVADNLQTHVNTLIDAIDAALEGSPDVFPELRTAAQHMPSTAAALSGAIAAQMPEQFPGS